VLVLKAVMTGSVQKWSVMRRMCGVSRMRCSLLTNETSTENLRAYGRRFSGNCEVTRPATAGISVSARQVSRMT
jgi:hypothetical protein